MRCPTTSQSGLDRCSERVVERTLKTASSETAISSRLLKTLTKYGSAHNFWIEASCVQLPPACLAFGLLGEEREGAWVEGGLGGRHELTVSNACVGRRYLLRWDVRKKILGPNTQISHNNFLLSQIPFRPAGWASPLLTWVEAEKWSSRPAPTSVVLFWVLCIYISTVIYSQMRWWIRSDNASWCPEDSLRLAQPAAPFLINPHTLNTAVF